VSNSPNTQPIDLPNSNGDNCCAAQWHAMTDQAATMSGETSRTDFIRSFGDRSDLFSELVNIVPRLNSKKINDGPLTHQHAMESVMIVQMSQRQKKL